MKIVVFGASKKVGLLQDDQVLDLAAAAALHPGAGNGSVFASLLTLIEAGKAGLDTVRALADAVVKSGSAEVLQPVTTADLQAPFPGRRMLMAGSNYAAHMANAFTNMGTPMDEVTALKQARMGEPGCFWAVSEPVGTGAQIPIPERAQGYFDYEGEVAIILGEGGKRKSAAQFEQSIWGVTSLIDWSIREPAWPPKPNNPWMPVKNFDASKSIGPCILVDDDLDVANFRVQTFVNGVQKQDHGTKEMMFSFGEIAESIARDLTLHAGDMIGAGTGAGTAIDSTVSNTDGSWPKDLFLNAGDLVEVRSPAGSLIGNVVEE